MARRRKNETQENTVPTINLSTPSQGYSEQSLKALEKGEYQNFRQGALASYKMKQARQKLPELQRQQQEKIKQNQSNTKPATRYENQPAAQSAPVSNRDTRFDKDFDNFYNYRYGDFSGEVDYDPVSDMDVEKWRNVKKDIMAKNKWSEKEFDDKFEEYSNERFQKQADTEVNLASDLAKKSSILGTLQNFAYLPQSILEGGMTALEALTGKNMATKDNNVQLTGTRVREAAKTAVNDKIDSNAGKAIYNVGTSLGDMALASAIPVLGVGALGGETAARTQLNALNRDVDARKAATQGALAGGISAFMNKVGLDKALGSTGKTALGSVANAAFKEGTENVLEDTANLALDTFLNDNKSEINSLHDYYVANGMGDEDAWTQVAKDKGIDLLTSFGSGAAFGAFMKGGELTANKAASKLAKVAGAATEQATENQIPTLKTRSSNLETTAIPEVTSGKVEVPSRAGTPTDTGYRFSVEEMRALGLDDETIRRQLEIYNNSTNVPETPEAASTTAPKNQVPDLVALTQEIENKRAELNAIPKEQTAERQAKYNELQALQNQAKDAINGKASTTAPIASEQAAARVSNAAPLNNEVLAAATSQIDKNKDRINALKAEIKLLQEDPKNLYRGKLKKAVQNDIYARQREISQLQSDNRSLQRQIEGKPTPIREQLSKEDKANLFNYKGGGFDTDVNYATQYAGNTPEAKALSKELKSAMKTFVESGDMDDFSLMIDKAIELDTLAKTANVERSTGNYFKTYSEYFGDESLVDKIAQNKALSRAFDLASSRNAASATGIDSTPRITEAVGESAPSNIDPAHELAERYAASLANFDAYGFDDAGVEQMASDIANGRDLTQYIDALETAIEDAPDEITMDRMEIIRDRLRNLQERNGYGILTDDDLVSLGVKSDIQNNQVPTNKVPDVLEAREEGNNVEANPAPQIPEGDEKVRSFSRRGSEDDSLPEEIRNSLSEDTYRVVRNAAPTSNTEVPEMKSEIGNVPPTDVGNVIDNVEGKNTKTSKTYTNTGRYGKGWTEEEYAKYTDPSQFQYEDISEMESMQDAAGMLQSEGLEGFKNRVMDKDRLTSKEIDGLMMEWRIISQQARMMEEAGEDAGDAWKESVKVFRKIQEQSTSNAQALQALAKWSRNTAEGMLAEAENILNGKKKMSQPDKSSIQKEFEKFAKQNKKFHFSDEFAEEFLKKAKPLEDMDRESREAKELMAELGKMVNRQLPAKLGEKAMTVLMDNMLGNFRTLISRNAGGNIGLNTVEQLAQRPLAALIDMGVSKKTGKRTQAGLSKEGLVEYVQGFTKGLKEELEDFKKDIHTARSGENDLANAVSQNRHVFKEKGVADKLDKLVRHGLSVGDRPFYEAVYNQTLGDYQRLRASGQMGDVVQSLNDADFAEYAQTAAKLNALSAVYQQDSKMAKALLSFKGAIGDLSRGVVGADILSQFSMPFVKTPANVVERAIDYSPLGMVRNTIRTAKELNNDAFDQNRFVNESARNILGTGLMAGGAGLAANGVMSDAYSEDKDEKQAQKEAGMQEYAWNVPDYIPMLGGKQMDIGWVPVVGSNLVASAAAYDAYKNGEGGFGQNLAKGIEKGGEALFDQSMFQGLQRLFGTGEAYDTDTGIVGNMANVVKSGLGQLVPSLARQAGQVIDPYQRDIGNSNEGVSFGMFDNYDLNNLANNIPFLRETALAPKVNTSGELVEENQGRNMVSKVLEDMILPGKLTEVQMSPLADEAKRLSDITTTKDAYMPKATRAVDTEGHTLSNEEWVDYQQKYYSELTNAGTMLMNNDYYKQADPAKQEKLLHDVYSDMRKAINSTYTGKEGSQTGAAKKYLEAGGGEKGMQEVVNYHLAAQKAKDLGMDTSTYLKKEAEAPGTADRWAQERDDAVQYGFVQKDGSPNVDAYDKALNIVGNNPQSMQAYSDYYKQGFTKNDQKVPYLMNNNAFTDEQKGKIIAGDKKYDDLGNTAKGAYDIQGYEGLYYYYLLKQLADTDGNGSIKKSEKNDLLNSDNPFVTSLSDDMYYYLANAKW